MKAFAGNASGMLPDVGTVQRGCQGIRRKVTPKFGLEGPSKENQEEPTRVLPVERLLSNAEALNKLTALVAPPRLRLRAQDVLLALFLTSDTRFRLCAHKERGDLI